MPAVKGVFMQAYYEDVASQWQQIAVEVPSTSDQERYGWLGSLPGMREWVDERVIKGLAESDYSLVNKKYESTIGVDRDAVDDDKLGALNLRIRSFAAEAASFIDETVFEALAAGFTALAYDGAAFFANRGTNQNNLGTTALSAAALSAARVAMRKFVSDTGRPLGINPNLLVVPPDLEQLAEELTASPIVVVRNEDSVTGTVTPYKNVLAGKLQYICSPWLTDTDNWFLVDTKRPLKPIIWQNRQGVEFTSREADSDTGFMLDQYLYGIRIRGVAGYGLPFLAYGSNVTGS